MMWLAERKINRRCMAATTAAVTACFTGIIVAAELAATAIPPLKSPTTTQPATRATIDINTRAAQLRDLKIDPATRRLAARDLLESDQLQAVAALTAALTPAVDPLIHRAIAQAISETGKSVPETLVEPLYALFPTSDDAVMADLAVALARCATPTIKLQLADIAANDKAPVKHRHAAVAFLAHCRSKSTVRLLIDLIDAHQPASLREASFAALTHLTGKPDLGADLAAWRQWWNEVAPLNDEQFIDHLITALGEARAADAKQLQIVQERLVEVQRQNYWLTPPGGQTVVLINMLGDSLDALRLAGVELADQRLRDKGPSSLNADLRAALRSRLDDPQPSIQEKTVPLLTALNDEIAADKVSQQLARNDVRRNSLTATRLRMMARLPRAAAVPRIIELMADTTMEGDAAGALAAAAEAKLLSVRQNADVLAAVRQRTGAVVSPQPQMVTLLGVIGKQEDWRKIEKWLDSNADPVREAAARAWAGSDRDLLALATRAGNAVVLPIFLDAAARTRAASGGNEKVFAILVNLRTTTQLAAEWRKALFFQAGKADPAAVLEAESSLMQSADPMSPTDCASLLSAAIEPIITDPKFIATQHKNPQLLADLLLARAEARALAGDPRRAIEDYQRIIDFKFQLSDTQYPRHLLGLIDNRLLVGEVEPAVEVAKQAIARVQGPSATDGITPILVERFVAGAQRAASTNQLKSVQFILDWLHGMQLAWLDESLQEKIGKMWKIPGIQPPPTPPTTSAPAVAVPPPTTSQPATQPTTQPAMHDQP